MDLESYLQQRRFPFNADIVNERREGDLSDDELEEFRIVWGQHADSPDNIIRSKMRRVPVIRYPMFVSNRFDLASYPEIRGAIGRRCRRDWISPRHYLMDFRLVFWLGRKTRFSIALRGLPLLSRAGTERRQGPGAFVS